MFDCTFVKEFNSKTVGTTRYPQLCPHTNRAVAVINLNIIRKASLSNDPAKVNFAIDESNELISIFVTSVKTAERNQKKYNN